MKLPTKRDYSSRSMASAMRRPVLESERDKYIGYQQDFTPMPTNYDDVGNAQARAALAKGEAGIALAQVGLDATKAAESAFQIQNKSRLLAKKAELASWLGGYVADASMRDLSLQTGKGKYGYETERAKFDKELRQFEDELNARFGIDDPYMAEEWRISRMGMLDEFGTQLDFLIDGAKDERAVADAGSALEKVQDHASLDKWAKEVGVFVFGPDKLNELVDLKTQEIEINSAYITIRDNPMAGSNNFLDGEIDTILEREDLKPDTREQMIKIIEAKKNENISEAKWRIANATDPGEIWAMWEFESGTNGNLPAEYEEIVRGRISGIEARSYISEIERYAEEGNLEMVADEALYASQNKDIGSEDRADIVAAQRRAINKVLSAELRSIFSGESLTTTTTDKDGNVITTTKQSQASIRIDEIREEIFSGPEGASKYGLAWNSSEFDANAEWFLNRLETLATNNARRKVQAEAEVVKMTLKERYIGLMASDPSTMKPTAFMNETWQDAKNETQAIFDKWAEGREGSVHELAAEFSMISGYVPSGYVEGLVSMLNDPSQDQAGAGALLIALYKSNPRILNQKGLSESFEVAMEAAWYVSQFPAEQQGNELEAFFQSRKTAQITPEYSKQRISSAVSGVSGDEFAGTYASLREQNSWWPETVSDDFKVYVERALQTIAPTTADNRWAYAKAISVVSQNFGVEMRTRATYDDDGEIDEVTKEPEWVYRSIYRFHDSGRAIDEANRERRERGLDPLMSSVGADEASQVEGGESGARAKRDSQNNFVQMTIDDIAKQNGYAPEGIEAVYMDDPSGPYWILTKNGVPLQKNDEFAYGIEQDNPGETFYLVVEKDTLSPRAEQAKIAWENQQAYDNAEQSYKLWEKRVGVVSEGPLGQQIWSWAGNLFDGSAQQGVDNLGPITPQERVAIDANDADYQNAEDGSREKAVAKAIGQLLMSDLYRKHLLAGETKVVQRLVDYTKSVAGEWYDQKGKNDLDKEVVQEGVVYGMGR